MIIIDVKVQFIHYKTEDNTSEVLIEIFEGKFHQSEKMVESVGKKVTYLKRLQMKNLK